jgi:epsilon-lactone hydrolase
VTELSERPGYPAPETLAARRRALADALATGALPRVEGSTEEVIAGVRTIRFGKAGPGGTTIVHFHGGGFRLGAPEAVAAYAADLARRSGATVYCPAYRLAPDAPFPAALNDGLRVVGQLAAGGSRLVLAGDSAGGGVAAAIVPLCARAGLAIAGLVLHSPWLDLHVSSASYRTNAAFDPLFSEASASEAAQMYLQGHPADDPLASPLFAEPAQFPPTLVSVGSGEVLLDDARRFHQMLEAASRPVVLCEVAGMDHVAVTRGTDLPGSSEVMARTLGFLAELG